MTAVAQAEGTGSEIGLATADDDAGLRALYREVGMAGDGPFRLAFSREPSFFDGLGVEGPLAQVCVCRSNAGRRIEACFMRSTRPVWINGEVREVGYLGGLRIRPARRGGRLLARGYRELNALHRDGRCRYYLSTILEGNSEALRVLTSGRAGLPAYHDIGRYVCSVILLRRSPRAGGGGECERGSRENMPEILDCLERNGARKQFYPHWQPSDFAAGHPPTRGFSIRDFFVVRRSGRIAGVLGAWDQSAFKQVTVEAYSPSMRLGRMLWNGLSVLAGYPRLPAVSREIPLFYCAFAAVDGDDPDLFRELLEAILATRRGGGYLCCILGLHERDPLLPVVARMRHLKYCSRAYVVCWQDGEDAFARLDDRVPFLEAALL